MAKLSEFLSTTYTGTAGPSGTIEIGTVTNNPGYVTITNVGTERSAILNFNIPPGDFDWPDTGIPVSTGSSWTSSLTVPAGVLVGTTASQTLTNKTISLTSNTVSGTISEFNAALSDADFATVAGSETLTNKTLTNPTISGHITFPDASTQSTAGATTGKAIAMAIVFGG